MAIPCHSLLPLASSCASNSSRIDCSWFRSWQHFFAAIRLPAVGARNIGIGHSCHQWAFNWNKHCELSILVSFNFPGSSCTTLSKYIKYEITISQSYSLLSLHVFWTPGQWYCFLSWVEAAFLHGLFHLRPLAAHGREAAAASPPCLRSHCSHGDSLRWLKNLHETHGFA